MHSKHIYAILQQSLIQSHKAWIQESSILARTISQHNLPRQCSRNKQNRSTKKKKKELLCLRKPIVLQLTPCLRPTCGGKRDFISIWRTSSLEKGLIPPCDHQQGYVFQPWNLDVSLSQKTPSCVEVNQPTLYPIQ